MKTNSFKYISALSLVLVILACSTKRDTFLARNSHALSTKYNIIYNGQIGFDKGIHTINANDQDNFWKILPIEKIQIVENLTDDVNTKNADFELAEAKATKAIQKHSMNIKGREKNSQMDEAYLLLGKARYFDQRFIPALDAFNYILYKYPTSSNINTARIWREKTNMRLGNDAIVVKNITKILHDIKVDKQVYADANALLAEAYLNLQEKDSTINKLRIATEFTKDNNEKARYRFILGQLFQEANQRDSALTYYQSVIDMNRKSDRKYMLQAYARKAQLFDYDSGDRDAFIEKYNELVNDRENRPYLDVLYYQMGVFFDKTQDQESALEFYNYALRTNSKDSYLLASSYRNIGNMYFKNTEYSEAAKYYDSTLVKLDPKTREYVYLKRARTNLNDVIKYEAIATQNDSILKLVGLSPERRTVYFNDYIEELKKSDEAKRVLEEKEQEKLVNIERNSQSGAADPIGPPSPMVGIKPPVGEDAKSVFYFYNPTTVSYGKLQFKKLFGNRLLKGNWRVIGDDATDSAIVSSLDDDESAKAAVLDSINRDPKYTVDYYVSKIPTKQVEVDSIAKERNFAYYQLGLIYKEKFKEYTLAGSKLEQLLQNNPEQKLILPVKYNLYKIYETTAPDKALAMKNSIVTEFPDSRYAQIITNKEVSTEGSPEGEYQKWYKLYEEEEFTVVLDTIDNVIERYSGDEIVSKFQLLKANALGKTKGLPAYKAALEEVATNYPNSDEGKNAQDILVKQIPILEKKSFTTVDAENWKILYQVPVGAEKEVKDIQAKFKIFQNDENFMRMTSSVDRYDGEAIFVVIHGIKSESYAYDLSKLLKENKKYHIVQNPVVISGSNYSIVQIKKNLNEYTASKTP